MKRKNALLLMLLIILAEGIIIAMAPNNIDLFWTIEGLIGGLALLFEVLIGRIPITKKFAPFLIGILLGTLGLVLMRMNLVLGWLGFSLDITGLTLVFYVFHMRNVSYNKSLEPITSETPKSFLKDCAACGRQIPIASEECPFCQAKQS
jgi:hypothetical protein